VTERDSLTYAQPAGEPYAGVSETLSAVVFFAGDRAYKLKKPVSTGFLDFSTPQARAAARTSPSTPRTPGPACSRIELRPTVRLPTRQEAHHAALSWVPSTTTSNSGMLTDRPAGPGALPAHGRPEQWPAAQEARFAWVCIGGCVGQAVPECGWRHLRIGRALVTIGPNAVVRGGLT